jgi:hypothetical protein
LYNCVPVHFVWYIPLNIRIYDTTGVHDMCIHVQVQVDILFIFFLINKWILFFKKTIRAVPLYEAVYL